MKKPNSSPDRAPATAAPTMPIHGLPVITVMPKPEMAPISIMPLDAQIEHAGFLDHQFAEPGQQDRRRNADDGDDGENE